MFSVNNKSKPLDYKSTDIFHLITEKLLRTMNILIPDLKTAVSFLCTRVHKPTTGGWDKLIRVLGLLKDKNKDLRILGADDLLRLETWIDSSHEVHTKMREHTGGVIYLSWGIVHGKYPNQKLNTKNMIRLDLLGMIKYVPYKIYTINFLET